MHRPMPWILFQRHFCVSPSMQTMLSQLPPMFHARELLPVWTKLHSILQHINLRYMHKRMPHRLLPDANPIRIRLLWSLLIKLSLVHRFSSMPHLQGHSYFSERPLCTSQLRQLRLMRLNRHPCNLQELYRTILLIQSQVFRHLPGVLLRHYKPNLSRQRVPKVYLKLCQLHGQWHLWCLYPWLHFLDGWRVRQWGCI